jgi:predicted RNA binding protein YcfA (HicA-like mRNA interferase family)
MWYRPYGGVLANVERILARLRRHPPEADFGDVRLVLEAYGWTKNHETGSHAIFAKSGERAISVPKVGGRRVKRVYIREVLARLGLGD